MKKNIVLIGIMGCGKTTISNAVSYKLKMPVVDMDKEIERSQGKEISEIFALYGEEYFRNLETDMSKRVSALKGYIISTGGGVVLREENMKYLKKTGKVLYIHRTPDEIVRSVNTEKRPLLKDGPEKLYEIYNARHNLYLAYADAVVNNNGNFQNGAQNVYNAILSLLNN